eukprot:TRINITY_DN4981_c0_g1_i1.p1 TRINITY_DN4981_c0_g1~~TRINITY_DN4981_c0_g1_i1.p1  ORF type:complete len:281 (+),score=38.96 TRINITY_DN4981_c0_g1_i1:149-991(+)
MSSNPVGRPSTKTRYISFSGHPAHIVSIARSCWEENKFTDVAIRCSNGLVHAHRLVLASCSTFLSRLFLSLPDGLSEYTILIPNMPREIVEILINFLYTGEMMIARSNTWDLQQLVHILQIDPENVRIDLEEESDTLKTYKINAGPSKKDIPSSSSRIGLKRTAPSDSHNNAPTPSKIIVRGQARTRGRPRGSGLSRGLAKTRPTSSTGFHDMMNVDTWVCAICGLFDPHGSSKDSKTEWIGCDCNRWYHQLCTKLKVLDKNFSCTKVNLKCLPPREKNI